MIELSPEHSPEEIPTFYDDVPVAVGDHTLGRLTSTPGRAFDLSAIFGQEAAVLGSDAVSFIFIKTESGNIYLLSESGELINARECQRSGKIAKTDVDRQVLQGSKIVIGEPYEYGSGHTTRVTHVIAATRRKYQTGALMDLSDGRRSTIADDMRNMLPPLPEENDQYPIPRILRDIAHLTSFEK